MVLVHLARAAQRAPPARARRARAGLVHPEAWVSPVTGDSLTEGRLGPEPLLVTVESNRLVAFGDGIEDDRLTLGWGQQLRVGLADQALHLVV